MKFFLVIVVFAVVLVPTCTATGVTYCTVKSWVVTNNVTLDVTYTNPSHVRRGKLVDLTNTFICDGSCSSAETFLKELDNNGCVNCAFFDSVTPDLDKSYKCPPIWRRVMRSISYLLYAISAICLIATIVGCMNGNRR